MRDLARELAKWGLLLEADPTLPSVASRVAGEPIRGSWWGHPRGREIFRASCDLVDHADALLVKLVSGKLTFVHRRLWPALVAVGRAREPWQMQALPHGATAVLELVDKSGSRRTDEIPVLPDAYDRKKAVAALEQRLLVLTSSVHTESGAHARVLESWRQVAARLELPARLPAPAAARTSLEEAVAELNAAFSTRATLPWRAISRGSRRPARGTPS